MSRKLRKISGIPGKPGELSGKPEKVSGKPGKVSGKPGKVSGTSIRYTVPFICQRQIFWRQNAYGALPSVLSVHY
jgi:hypothetical protein